MQQMLNSMPSRKIHIPLCDALLKKAKKFFTIESLMVFIFCVSFTAYQILSKNIFLKKIHIPLHATHFNIDYNEEKMLIAEVEESLIQKFYIFLLEFFVFSYLFLFLFSAAICPQDEDGTLIFFAGFMMFFCMLVYLNYNNLPSDLTHNQKGAFIFKKDLNQLLKNIQEYPINRNENSILSINRYNREVDSYNLNIQNIEDFLKEEKSYFKNYVIAQALINLDQKNIHIKYVKNAADYFIETPVDKLEFSPRADIVFNIESKAYGKAISHLAKKYQSSISDFNTSF